MRTLLFPWDTEQSLVLWWGGIWLLGGGRWGLASLEERGVTRSRAQGVSIHVVMVILIPVVTVGIVISSLTNKTMQLGQFTNISQSNKQGIAIRESYWQIPSTLLCLMTPVYVYFDTTIPMYYNSYFQLSQKNNNTVWESYWQFLAAVRPMSADSCICTTLKAKTMYYN